MKRFSDRTFVLIGWWLFVVSAVFFIVASLRAGDMAGLVGGIAFLTATFAFLTPFYPASSLEDRERED